MKSLSPALAPGVGAGMRVDRKIQSPSYLQELKFEAPGRIMCRSGKGETFSTVTISLNGCNGKIAKPRRNYINIHHLLLLHLLKC